MLQVRPGPVAFGAQLETGNAETSPAAHIPSNANPHLRLFFTVISSKTARDQRIAATGRLAKKRKSHLKLAAAHVLCVVAVFKPRIKKLTKQYVKRRVGRFR